VVAFSATARSLNVGVFLRIHKVILRL